VNYHRSGRGLWIAKGRAQCSAKRIENHEKGTGGNAVRWGMKSIEIITGGPEYKRQEKKVAGMSGVISGGEQKGIGVKSRSKKNCPKGGRYCKKWNRQHRRRTAATAAGEDKPPLSHKNDQRRSKRNAMNATSINRGKRP